MANPNPSPETRFKHGNNVNPGGKTKEQKRLEMEAAQMAAELRHKMLSAMTEKVSSDDDALLAMLDANTLKLFKDSEDRAHGTPKQSTEITGDPEKPVGITAIERLIVKTPDPDA